MKKSVSLLLPCLIILFLIGCNKQHSPIAVDSFSSSNSSSSSTQTKSLAEEIFSPVENSPTETAPAVSSDADISVPTGGSHNHPISHYPVHIPSSVSTTSPKGSTQSSTTISSSTQTATASVQTTANTSTQATTTKPAERRPVVTGDFIQPWLCGDWSVNDWESHYDTLLDVGINTMIIQWTAETPSSRFQYTAYPSAYAQSHKASNYSSNPSLLNNALCAAEKKGIKVFIGLNLSNDWWKDKFTSSSWCEQQADIGNMIAQETYSLYKEKYPHAFYGWYWAWEMYNQNSGYESNWASMINRQLDYLTSLDSRLPILFSPFISSYIPSTPAQLEAQWTSFFQQAHFRPGDIFCPQDSVGASGLSMEYLENQTAAMKRASQKEPGLQFWINCENFTADGNPASLERFIRQMKMASKYTDTLITFSYSHYYADNQDYHCAYKAYVNQ